MTAITNPAAHKKLATARAQLLLNRGHGFWGTLALRLELVEEPQVKTLAVDGKHVFYNPDFVLSLSDSLTRSALAHEVMHCVFDHMNRLQGRDLKKWNVAGDYAINQVLEDASFEIGKGWLLNAAYKDMSADEIYNLMPDLPPDDGGDQALDEVLPGIATQAESNAIEWKIATIQAAQQAKAAGNLPSSMSRFIEDATKPQVNWREQLRRFVTQISKDDYAWSRPNRRYLSAGLYLPGLYSESMGDIVVCVDTSGSIDQKTLDTFGAEIKSIVAAVRPANTHVIYCDAEVNHVDTFGPYDDMRFKLHGGGGTDFNPPFEHVEQQQLRPECLVYLTDGYGPFPNQPDYATLWVMTTDVEPPFGETIRIEV